MLIDFRQLFPKYGIKATGVLHIGANIGEEAPVYLELGIQKQYWIEANLDIYKKLVLNLANNPDAKAFNYCIGDEEGKEVVFHESNNAGQSSSILELGTHLIAHPEVHYVKDTPMIMKRIDNLFTDEFNEGNWFLNIDLQGAELMALKGIGSLLNHFSACYLEVNKAELYVGCPLVQDIDLFLSGFGFTRVETKWAGNTNWGDGLYIKR